MAKVGLHLDEETVEKYSMSKLSSRKVVEAEKHLLVCEACQKAVADSDAYVAAMKKAAAGVRKSEEKQKPRRRVAGK
ncbi:MAG TPA: hypothetical protein VHW09_07790 [Bryobacteraceae bacterium]|jgi:hypothetical protein|nr:hypothetical protein [Bryobacteraceae bacterium]